MTRTEERDGWMHKVQSIQGEYRGRDEQLTRLLQTALDAARAEPPFMPCVLERLEDALTLLRKTHG